jgi:hypothetical protein
VSVEPRRMRSIVVGRNHVCNGSTLRARNGKQAMRAGERMAHHKAEPEFDFVAFDKHADGTPKWEHTPRTISNAKAKARRKGYAGFFIARSDHPRKYITRTMHITRYVYDSLNSHWLYS